MIQSPETPLPVAILAGGLATRLRPLTEKIPKALLELNGEPFIVHQLRLLHSRGIRHAVLCIGYLGEMVQAAVGDGAAFGIKVDYVFDGPKLLGTAGALKRATAAIPALGGSFFTLYGDSYLPIDYLAVQRHFTASGKSALMTVYKNIGQFDASNVVFDGTDILVYDKKAKLPEMHHIDYGLGVFRASAFDRIPPDTVADLATLYQQLLAEGQLAGCEIQQRFYEIGSITGLQDTAQFLRDNASPR